MASSKGGRAAQPHRPYGEPAKGRDVYTDVDSRYPAEGPGSVATFGARLLAFVVDGILADLIAIGITGFENSGRHSLAVLLAFLLIEFVFVSFFGQTPGMRVAGVGVVKADTGGRQAPQWILVRTLLIAVVAPALIIDATGRAMHDRAVGTVMLRTR